MKIANWNMRFMLKRLALQAHSEKQMVLIFIGTRLLIGKQRNIHVDEPQLHCLRALFSKRDETFRATNFHIDLRNF